MTFFFAGFLILLAAFFVFLYFHGQDNYCLTGAFLADKPSVATVSKFQKDYGKKPALVLIFLDWGKYPDAGVVRNVYESGSALVVTWEPWRALQKKAIDYDALLAGKDDVYIREFALKLKAVGNPVFLRFAHEMNGDWYPWSGQKIGGDKYQRIFRHVREIFDQVGAGNTHWIFSVNAENIPKTNTYESCYPGNRFVDDIGLDGYNWGTVQPWSRWRSFRDIFSGIYHDVRKRYSKPVMITEFSSTSRGGDKARWVEEALRDVKKMKAIKGLILFNFDKETDWYFPPQSTCGQKLKQGLSDPYFLEVKERALS